MFATEHRQPYLQTAEALRFPMCAHMLNPAEGIWKTFSIAKGPGVGKEGPNFKAMVCRVWRSFHRRSNGFSHAGAST